MNIKPEKPRKVTIEAAEGGWIVRETGKPAHVYMLWEFVIRRLEESLTIKGN